MKITPHSKQEQRAKRRQAIIKRIALFGAGLVLMECGMQIFKARNGGAAGGEMILFLIGAVSAMYALLMGEEGEQNHEGKRRKERRRNVE